MLKRISFKGRFTPAIRTRIISTLVFSIAIVTAFSFFASAKTVYTITDGGNVTKVSSYFSSPNTILATAGISIDPSDKVVSDESSETPSIKIVRSQMVTIQCDGASINVLAYDETVGEILSRAGISLGKYDELSVSPTDQVTDGMVIKVTRKIITYKTVTEELPYKTIKKDSVYLYTGDKKVITQGVSGIRTDTYEITTSDGKEVSRALVDSKVTTQPVSKVVAYGTKAKSKSVAAASGKNLSYSKVITCVATAYTTQNQSCKITATGTTARVGAIAVDPKVIPYGTKMYIVTSDGSIIYGVATAEDCGAFSGKRIDLFYNTRSECVNFGRRTCNVYILN
ncbi:MAG: G5 domain-containing protein [Oscillospiraceae bacterium]|nr:G5 domain-containing protein [Oscillospiraceae bacterium]